MYESGKMTFLPPSPPCSTIQGTETYEKDARAQWETLGEYYEY